MRSFLNLFAAVLLAASASAQVSISNPPSNPDPSAMLDIKSTNRGVLLPRVINRTNVTSPAAGLIIYETATSSMLIYNGTQWVELGAASAAGPWTISGDNIYNSNVGNTGVGTNAPTAKFHVEGNSLVRNGSITITDDFASLYLRGISSNVNRAYVRLNGSNLDLVVGTLPLNTEGNFLLQTQGNTRMTIDPVGNVGIGITNPGKKLEVNGTIFSSGRIEADGVMESKAGVSSLGGLYVVGTSLLEDNIIARGTLSASGNINSNTSMTITDAAALLTLRSNASTDLGFVQLSGNNLRVGTFSSNTTGKFIVRTGGGDRLFVDEYGNVSIGSSQVGNGYKLSVAGKVIAEEMRVQLRLSWPDYVFNKKYNLMPLQELEQYINSNQHLPNIPAAAEVQKTGIDVSEMQTRMMEKIEELTLYIIQQQKEIDALKVKVNNKN